MCSVTKQAARGKATMRSHSGVTYNVNHRPGSKGKGVRQKGLGECHQRRAKDPAYRFYHAA